MCIQVGELGTVAFCWMVSVRGVATVVVLPFLLLWRPSWALLVVAVAIILAIICIRESVLT